MAHTNVRFEENVERSKQVGLGLSCCGDVFFLCVCDHQWRERESERARAGRAERETREEHGMVRVESAAESRRVEGDRGNLQDGPGRVPHAPIAHCARPATGCPAGGQVARVRLI